jgi:hypothetical protein
MEKNNDAQQKLTAPSTTTMPSMSEKWQILSKIYTNPLSPGGYAGADALFKAVKQLQPRNRRDKITRKDVIDFLEEHIVCSNSGENNSKGCH